MNKSHGVWTLSVFQELKLERVLELELNLIVGPELDMGRGQERIPPPMVAGVWRLGSSWDFGS